MNIKNVIKKMIPSIRAKEALLAEFAELNNRITSLEKQISNLDYKNEYLFYCLQKEENESIDEVKSRVLRNMPAAEKESRLVQLAENEILIYVKSICDENNISILPAYGTLLGAVRNRGFIPWDDDIDVLIDYEVYCKLESLLENDEFVSMKRYYRYLWGSIPGYITKIKMKGSDNIYIDVYAYTFIHVGDCDCLEVWKESERLNKEYHDSLKEVFEAGGINSTDIPIACSSIDEIVRKKEAEMNGVFRRKYPGEPDYFCICITSEVCDRKTGLHRVDEFLPLCKNAIEFEEHTYDAFRNSEKLLMKNYDDYLSMPSKVMPPHKNEIKGLSENELLFLIKEKNNG